MTPVFFDKNIKIPVTQKTGEDDAFKLFVKQNS
jgi:hypothetical protein